MPDRDTVIAMAAEAGFYDTGLDQWVVPCSEILIEFAALVAAQEREANAALCEAEAWRLKAIAVKTQSRATNSRAIQASECADLIRARKEET